MWWQKKMLVRGLHQPLQQEFWGSARETVFSQPTQVMIAHIKVWGSLSRTVETSELWLLVPSVAYLLPGMFQVKVKLCYKGFWGIPHGEERWWRQSLSWSCTSPTRLSLQEMPFFLGPKQPLDPGVSLPSHAEAIALFSTLSTGFPFLSFIS